MFNKRIEAIRFKLKNQIDSSQEAINSFKENLDRDPSYAMRWSDKAFRASAEYTVARIMLNTVDVEGMTFDRIFELIEQAFLRESTSLSRSTSPGSNIYQEEERVSWGEIYKMARSLKESSEFEL